jgi:hypothetical protein
MTLLDVEDSGGARCGERSFLFGRKQISSVRRDTGTEANACLELLQFLTQQEWATLAGFARGRLLRVGLNPFQAEDMVQDAVLAVLKGVESSSEGRHPRGSDLANRHTFTDYLRAVVASLVESERRKGWNSCAWEKLDETIAHGHAIPGQEIAGLVFRDLHWKFFSILARRTPHRLQELVEAWKEQGEDCEKIPVLGRHRRCRAELRTLAAQVLKSLLAPAPSPFRRKLSNEPKR